MMKRMCTAAFLALWLALTGGAAAQEASYADGIYRGFYYDGGIEQIAIQFELQDGVFQSVVYRGVKYKDGDYMSDDASDAQKAALRQYLNGKGTNWWKPQNKWDRPPEYAGKHGFLDGIPAEELAVMRRVKVVTGVPYCEEGTANEPVLDTTYDLVFLPSLEEHFLALNESGMKGKEGEAWEYWARIAQSPTPLALWQTWPQLITYAINGKTSPQNVWTRSALRTYGLSTFIVYSSGNVGYNYAQYGYRCAPARAI